MNFGDTRCRAEFLPVNKNVDKASHDAIFLRLSAKQARKTARGAQKAV
jgi:hypothetical protein